MTPSTFDGSCHCGAVRYQVTMPAPEKATACNCSICSRAGWLLTFVPAENVRFESGEHMLKDYQFGKRHLHHVFCPTCGIHPFSRGAGPDGREMFGVNLRCLAGVDVTKLDIQHFDGASR